MAEVSGKNGATKAKDDNLLVIDVNDLTLGEIELIEEVGGMPIGWLGNPDKPQGKGMVAMALAIGRRKDAEYTLDQARNMRIEIKQEEVPPTEKKD